MASNARRAYAAVSPRQDSTRTATAKARTLDARRARAIKFETRPLDTLALAAELAELSAAG